MARELMPALKKLKALGAPHVHYKVCSTFDSSPTIGSIGRVIDVAAKIFKAPFVPLLVAAPPLGRHCVFGNLFARFGIGSDGAIHRLDRHPSISRHPVTPMTEADLRVHLAKRAEEEDHWAVRHLKLELPRMAARAALKKIIADGAKIVLFYALYTEQLERIGEMIDDVAGRRRPLFSVGSSGIEMALGAHWQKQRRVPAPRWSERWGQSSEKLAGTLAPPVVPVVKQILVGSGSCSPVTAKQIRWALANGFVEVALDTASLATGRAAAGAVPRAADAAVRQLKAGHHVIVHGQAEAAHKETSKQNTLVPFWAGAAPCFGTGEDSPALHRRRRHGSFAARARHRSVGNDRTADARRAALPVHAPSSPAEAVFKGGQVGAEVF
jgi:uncharacterized protein YgbK (DUF1537 family)